jgi:cytochrome c oxidase subunit IV
VDPKHLSRRRLVLVTLGALAVLSVIYYLVIQFVVQPLLGERLTLLVLAAVLIVIAGISLLLRLPFRR